MYLNNSMLRTKQNKLLSFYQVMRLTRVYVFSIVS